MGIELGCFGTDGSIDVAYGISGLADELDGLGEQSLAVNALILRVAVGKMVADIAQVGGTEQGVADSMYEYVGITVAQQSDGAGDEDAAEPELAAFYETVDVVA